MCFCNTTGITYLIARTFSTFAELNHGIIDFGCVDVPIEDYQSKWLQVPIAGCAIVPVYHISSLNNNSNNNSNNNGSLVLDGETLAMIFMGNISTWDDPAIQLLNPNLTLPNANITIAISPGSPLSQTSVFKRALSLFSEEFARELANAQDALEMLRPAMEGRAFITPDQPERLRFVQVGY